MNINATSFLGVSFRAKSNSECGFYENKKGEENTGGDIILNRTTSLFVFSLKESR